MDNFVKENAYRMGSWWLLWEDLIFPEDGIKEKIVQRARKFRKAGIDTVVIFGCHFRWDYIYNWERFHQLLTFIVDSCHEEEIKVFDHHSANLTHRVSSLDEYQNVNMKNRHHVPFFPSREFADSITFDGHKLNDFRMLSVQDGKPCYLDTYNAEIFCMNNTDFVNAYQKYLKKLLETGIDGLMCDDVIYYPGWDGCACEYCRKKFKAQYGHDLPPTSDEDFWGNYESPAFKDWMNMRYHDPLDFLTAVKETVGDDFPLMSCCSSSSVKALNSSGMSAEIMVQSLNNVMLEICGEIVSDKSGYCGRIPDFMLHKAIADKYGFGYVEVPVKAKQPPNVIIRVPGTSDYADSPVVCLQAHTDMVCQKTPQSNHDFDKDPIIPIIEDGWIRADNTTLGADDGIGVAMAMAAALTEQHPPLELLLGFYSLV